MPQRNHYFARIPTIFLLVLLGTIPWLAVVLFILRAVDRDAEKRELGQGKYAGPAYRAQQAQTAGAAYDYTAAYAGRQAASERPTFEQQKAKKHQNTLTTLCTILGALFLFAGVTTLPESISTLAATTHYSGGWVGSWPLEELLSNLAMIAGGGGALVLGLALRRTAKLERQLDKVVGSQDNIPLDELFAAAGLTYKEGRKVLESAIDHGYFGPDAYIDNRTGFLVVRGDAPIPAPPPQPAPAEQPAPDGETRYQSLLRQLHEAGAALTDAGLRDKAARLEAVSARIFAAAEADPDKEEQLRKFTGYYLPTALKLLRTYAQLDGQGIDGENITKTKQSIERSLDLLVTAFENQLDKLFQSDALDVSADIAALEGMLNLDGLSGENGFNVQ